MLRFLSATLLALPLMACSNQNMSLTTMQFSGETEPFPSKYQQLSAEAVAAMPTLGPRLLVSKPATTIGTTPFSPKRWYSCVRGVSGDARGSLTVYDTVEGFLDPASKAGVYNVVVFFRGDHLPSIKSGYDSPLCRQAAFEAMPGLQRQ